MRLQNPLRPIVNILMTAGYLSGLLLVWIGLETLTIERGWFLLGIFQITCGLVLWTMLNLVGRFLAGVGPPQDKHEVGP